MKLYRAMSRLRIKDRTIEKHCVFMDSELSAKSIDRLLQLRRIAPVKIPPIVALWPDRAEKLAEAGIFTFEDLLLANPENTDGLEAGTVSSLQREALRLFEPREAVCKFC